MVVQPTDCGSPGNAVPGRGVLDFYDGCRSSTFSMLSVATFTALPSRYIWQSGLTHSANGNVDVTGVWSPVGTATVTVENVPASSPSLGVSWTMNIGRLPYEADNAGFGYVDSELLGDPTGSLVRITYPTQDVTRARLGYEANGLSWGMADRFSVAAWGNWNQRTLDFNIQVPGFELYSHNFTDIASYGLLPKT